MGDAGVDIFQPCIGAGWPILQQRFDYVITVYDQAHETCPVFLSVSSNLHWNFDDLAKATGSYEQQLMVFRKSRKEIADKIRQFIA